MVIRPLAQLGGALAQARHPLPHGGAVDQRLGLPAGSRAQLRGDLDEHRHQAVTAAGRADSNASTLASMLCTTKESRTPSSVFSPSPVISSTTRSPGSISPRSASLRSTAVVTPPADSGT